MAHNTDPKWIEQQAKLEACYEGPDVREELYKCMCMLKESHDLHMLMTRRELEEEARNG